MKALSNMSRLQVSSDYLLLLIKVYEAKGKEFYYDDLFQRDKDIFKNKVIETNAFYLGKILKFDFTEPRLKHLSRKKLVPKNKQEALFLNIKKALHNIQNYPKEFEVLANEFDDLAKLLGKDVESAKFKTIDQKKDGTLFSNGNKINGRNELEELVKLYLKQEKTKQYELIQLIANFYVDYIHLEPFTLYNDIISYIILYAFLVKDFAVFKYVSFFESFYNVFDSYIQALNQANYYYSTGYPNVDLLQRLIVDILWSSYEKMNDFVRSYSFEKKLNKGDSIESTIRNGKEIFTKEDIRLAHPTVAKITIDRTLKRLKDEGLIQPLGKGRSSKWQRIDERKRRGGQQLDIFYFTEDV
ncbi:hypothetical protein [Acholeplasma equifetale]|uniref:hypothetical protein n=1 Tax=Acholeplasma equifetale TaxID=264634 RepID=UPI00138ADED6|nr:hypothetical protein [Acholeplasma equifetale]